MGATWYKPVQNGSRTQNSETCGSDGEGFQRLREEVELGEGVPLPREDPYEHGR